MSQQDRKPTWAGLGSDVTGCPDYMQVLKSAGLDYNVVKRPIKVAGFEEEVTGTVATVKETGPLYTFGFVGPNYEVCQNVEAFDFISDIQGGMEFVKAGTNAGRVWIIAKFPETEVLGDKIQPHLIFQNGHDGKHSISTNLCMLRIACQNQFNHSFKNAANVIKIRHSGMLNERLAEARKVMASAYEYVGQYSDMANEFAGKKINDRILQQILKTMFNLDDIETPTDKKQEKIDAFMNAYGSADNQNFVGTKWGVINAYTDFATHLPLPRNTDRSIERRFLETTVDSKKVDRLIEIVEAA